MALTGSEVTILVDPGFPLEQGSIAFYNKCVKWAQGLEKIVGGGISLKFWGGPGWIQPVATFSWRGREIVRLSLNVKTLAIEKLNIVSRQELTPKNAWGEGFRRPLRDAIVKERETLSGLLERINSANWE